MDTSQLRRWEIAGLVASLVLIGSLFLEWFSLDIAPDVQRDEPDDWVCGVGEDSCTAWETFPVLRWLLLAAATAPFVLTYLVARGHRTSWPMGEMTAVVGLTALVLIAYNGLIDKPSPNDLGVNLSYGYWIGLLAALVIHVTGGFRAVESGSAGRRKPPGEI